MKASKKSDICQQMRGPSALIMCHFDPALSLLENHSSGFDLEFAAWANATEDERREYRTSGSPSRTAYLKLMQIKSLQEALANSEMVAIGVIKSEHQIPFAVIPSSAFKLDDLTMSSLSSEISVSGVRFSNVKVLLSPEKEHNASFHRAQKAGRPAHLDTIILAWATLKAEQPGFVNIGKSSQNRSIQEVAATLFPEQFPGNARIGESTIRRHRRMRPELFD